MASDLEDDDLENLRKAALATLKPKVQTISSISNISRSQQGSPWQEFPPGADVVPEHQYQPEPLPEPELAVGLQNILVPPLPALPTSQRLPSQHPMTWAPPFMNGIRGDKIFGPRGFRGDRRPFHPRGHQRSFGDRGRPIHDRGRFPRRGYVSDRGRGFFPRSRGRGQGPIIHQFPPPDADAAAGNLIVINPGDSNTNETSGGNSDRKVEFTNTGPKLSVQEMSSTTRLVLPQDKYHSSDTATVTAQITAEPPAPKPRDKFSRYNDSDSEEEEEDWEDAHSEAEDIAREIDQFLQDADDDDGDGGDTRIVEETGDVAETTEDSYEVEIRTLEVSDNEEEEPQSKLESVGDEPAQSSPLPSDNESVDLDALAEDEPVLEDGLHRTVDIVEKRVQSPAELSTKEDSIDHLAENIPNENAEVTEKNKSDENAHGSQSAPSSSSSSSSSSSTSSDSSSSEDEDEDKDGEEDKEDGVNELRDNGASSVSTVQAAAGEGLDEVSAAQQNRSLARQSPQQTKISPQRATSPSRSVSPGRGFSPQGVTASPHRSVSPRRSSVSPRRTVSPNGRAPWSPRRSRSPRRPRSPRRDFSPRRKSLSPHRRRSLSPRRRLSPYQPSPSRHSSRKSISPRRQLSPRPYPSRRCSVSPDRYRSPRRSLSPHRPLSPQRCSGSPHGRPLSTRQTASPSKRPLSPNKQQSSPGRRPFPSQVLSPRRHAGSPNRNRDNREPRRQDRRYDRDRFNRDGDSKYSPSGRGRDRFERCERDSRYRRSRSRDTHDRRQGDKSNTPKDSPGRFGRSSDSRGGRSKSKENKVVDPPLPQIDLDKLTPEERAKIEARRKKFCSNEVKIDPAKKVSLKSIKERSKKRKKSGEQGEVTSVTEKQSQGRRKSEDKKTAKNSKPQKPVDEDVEETDSEGDDGKLAELEEESDDSDTGRGWRQEGNKTQKTIQALRIPGKSNAGPVSLSRNSLNADDRRTARRHTDVRQRNRSELGRSGRQRDQLPFSRRGFQRREEMLSDDESEEDVIPNRLTSSIVSAKPFKADIPPEKLRIEVQVAPKEKKTKKSKVKPDFSHVYAVPAKRKLEAQDEEEVEDDDAEELLTAKKLKKRKKEKKKKKKHAKEMVEPVFIAPPATADSSDEEEETETTPSVPPQRPSVLERLGKKVPFKEKKKKKKKKKSHSDEEVATTELDAKIQKIKAKNAAIARRQKEIELDKKKYG